MREYNVRCRKVKPTGPTIHAQSIYCHQRTCDSQHTARRTGQFGSAARANRHRSPWPPRNGIEIPSRGCFRLCYPQSGVLIAYRKHRLVTANHMNPRPFPIDNRHLIILFRHFMFIIRQLIDIGFLAMQDIVIQSSDETHILEEDFVNLSRLAASEAFDDVRMLLAKLVRKYRITRPEFAQRLNTSLRAANARSGGSGLLRRHTPEMSKSSDMPVDADSRMSLIRVFDDRAGLQPPLLPEGLFDQIHDIARERKQRARLAKRGVTPSRSAILVGPPGVGKTLSARWIAHLIGKPLWILDLTTVMSSLLGKTGNNLRAVFDHARQNEAVLLLDEIDAIAKRRSDESDVGELKRLVTAILQEVDAWPDSGLLLAATNHPELVDPALWRRFDVILSFPATDASLLEQAVERFLGLDLSTFQAHVQLLALSLQGMSLSDVERAVTALRRTVALKRSDPTTAVLAMAKQHVSHLDKPAKRRLAIAMAGSETFPHTKIMELTGVSRDTIRKYAGPSPIKGRPEKKEA